MTVWKAGALAIALVGGVGLYAVLGLRMERRERITDFAPEDRRAMPPKAERSFPCRIVPRQTVWAGAQLLGPLEAVYIDTGQTVQDGQVLARVRSGTMAPVAATSEEEAARALATDLKAKLAGAHAEAKRSDADVLRARAAMARLEPAYRKQELLNQAGATPRVVFERTRAEYQQAVSTLAAAEEASRLTENAAARLEDQRREAADAVREKARAAVAATVGVATAEIHSPAAGLVVERRVKPGDMVTETNRAELFRIAVQPELLRAEFDGNASFKTGEKVSIRAGDRQISAVVNNPSAADFESRIGTVVPGTPCQVTVGIK